MLQPKRIRFSVLNLLSALMLVVALVSLPGSLVMNEAYAAVSTAKLNGQIQQTLNLLPQQVPGAAQVLRSAKGVLVFPDVYQGAFVIGAEYGRGGLTINRRIIRYYKLMGGSIGWQIGGQRKSIIIAFMTTNALQNFQQSKGWDIGADASVALFDKGIEDQVTAGRLSKPIIAFVTDQKGLMAGVSLQGLKISPL